jgi:hypothetical protein
MSEDQASPELKPETTAGAEVEHPRGRTASIHTGDPSSDHGACPRRQPWRDRHHCPRNPIYK